MDAKQGISIGHQVGVFDNREAPPVVSTELARTRDVRCLAIHTTTSVLKNVRTTTGVIGVAA